jgi:enoyl-CoA hydratase/carnithine racemase
MTAGEFTEIRVDRQREGVAVVVLDRPERLNALSRRMRDELVAALEHLDAAEDVGAVVITGAGDRAFAAGQDLTEAQTLDEGEVGGWIDEWTRVFQAVLGMGTPTVAAVNGYAVGAAFQLAAVCDLRIASPNARFGMPEIDDAIPCVTGTWSLWELLGRGRIADLILTGRMVGADEALTWGIVSRIVPADQLLAEALQVAGSLARKSAKVLALNKRLLAQLTLETLPDFERYAKEAHGEAFASGEPKDVMARFLEGAAEGRG